MIQTRFNLPYNDIDANTYDELIFSPLQQALGNETWQRINRQIRDYEYYKGRQHVDPLTGQLVYADQLERPPGLDYDPTRFNTNYFKSFIDKKARWLMSGKHGISVEPRQIDDVESAQPSPEQHAENERAEGYEKLLYQLWRENRMRTSLIKAARDYLIARRVAVKIEYSERTGKMRWIWKPDTEVVPVYSDADMTELIAVHFVSSEETGDGRTIISKESFTLDEQGRCFYEFAEYNEALERIRTIVDKSPTGLNFIPVVLIAVPGLSAEEMDTSEIGAMRAITDRLNAMNEDAIDALKFEMFAMTALLNVPEGTSSKVEIAPGAVIEVTGSGLQGEASPDVKRIEGKFQWSAAFDAQYGRLKGALHEITSLPNIVPQELNFGGLNGDALHVLFQAIIQETEEHWLEWEAALCELHEKTTRYMQARVDRPNFAYDRELLRAIGNDYECEIKFVLPLPDNRRDLVELLSDETASGFESIAGAMHRLGVENVTAKKQEIEAERASRRRRSSIFGEDETHYSEDINITREVDD